MRLEYNTMALEKDKNKLQEICSIREMTGVSVRWASPAKFKKNKSDKGEGTKNDIEPGVSIVVLVSNGSEVVGYLKCVIIDYEVEESIWDYGTKIICQVVDYSIDSLKDRVGRIICTKFNKYYSGEYTAYTFYISGYKWLKKHEEVI